MSAAKVYTIPSSQSFVDVLAEGIRQRWGDTPESLAQVRVLLPTRRACRSLREAFLRQGQGEAMLLPVMVPLGDVDEDELTLESTGLEDALDLPPAVGALRRVLLLGRYVMARDERTTPDQAVRLGSELARLIDQVHTEGLDLARLPDLVKDEELAEHWDKTVEFLKIVGETWPEVLRTEGLLDPAKRRDELIRTRAQAWMNAPPTTPVVAAGSTGTIPATAELLEVVANLPQGALVLPGLDAHADDEVWTHLDPTHPQYGMAQLLNKVGLDRHAVAPWQGEDTPHPRQDMVQLALQPADVTARWRDLPAISPQALQGLTQLECANPREEAATIAVILREALEVKGQTAALITPDRNLARRVAVEMERWGVTVDDSAGQPLDQTPPGAFFNLVADMAADGFAPISVLAALKHPLAAGGWSPAKMRAAARALEVACLRGPRPSSGLKGLENQHRLFLSDKHKVKRFERMGLNPNHVGELLRVLHELIEPLADLLSQKNIDAGEVLKLHAAAAERLAQTDVPDDKRQLWGGDAGEALSGFVAEAHDALTALGPISGEDYPALIAALMAGRPVRPNYNRHPRIFIWGLLEARLQRADVTILGGLNEGSWPPEPEASPWMSRPMMKDFGLPLPERRIGLSAHDFAQAICAPRVILTRAIRSGSSPQVPSRWLVRMETLLGKENLPSEPQWLDWASQLTRPPGDGQAHPCKPPKPTPPVSARPTGLSATAVEKWIRDPYAIYAQRILNLNRLDDIEADANAADRGNIVHEVLERFVSQHMDTLPPDSLTELLAIGEVVFKEQIASPAVRAFWWPRFKRIAAWFVAFETQRRARGIMPKLIERKGSIEIDGFRLTAQADRLDMTATGELAIIDYKTGQAPTTKQVASGLTPQLPLEGLIAREGGFDGLGDVASIAQMLYVRLSGGRQPGEEKPIKLDGEEEVQKAFEKLTKLIHKFADESTPYLSRPRPMFASRYSDFDHLARVQEWEGEEDL